ncbi:MAG: amino acid ABC transporter permease [Anaeromicrobium sp.]|jgi:putative amino-acid transport system permease protein|uniref:amino acid ABC transporter permease n=1 Tax=Anaeromicrobium sp. TaxID=1929132 RepID=UPI0025F2889E|nr:amino acid ABC transporter permease [Anaeromicrobium sp.]MCT4592938.1 amino acid ABC transporter permease [Anaeromicrobium sp.]
MSNIEISVSVSVFPLLLDALGTTLFISITSFILAIVLGVLLALGVHFKVKVVSTLTSIYISFFRGTPLMIQIFFFYFGLPKIMPFMKSCSPHTALIICLGLNAAAYICEAIRGSIDSVEKGQYDACKAFGMSKFQSMYRIILPQGLISAIPPISSSLIDIIKGSSLGLTIGVLDIMSVAQVEAASSFKYFEVYITAILIYWVLSIILNIMQNKLEKQVRKFY